MWLSTKLMKKDSSLVSVVNKSQYRDTHSEETIGNVRIHKKTISASTIDFQPTLMYESTSADLRQQRLTCFCAVCGVLFY